MAAAATDICDICRDTFSLNPQNTVCTISCGHVFHETCLKKWFQTQSGQGRPTACPNCRRATRFDQIIRLYGISNPPATTRPITTNNIRQTICERSRILNTNERPVVTTPTSTTLTTIWNVVSINHHGFSRKVYFTLAIKLLLTLSILMLTTFHHGSKQFICEHYVIIIFTTCFLCGLVYCITNLEDDTDFVGIGSIFYLSIVTIGNIWNLEPCVTTMYPFQILIVAIVLTAFTAFILTKIAFRMDSNLTAKAEILGWSLFLLIFCFVIWRFADKDNLVVYIILQSLCLLISCCYLIVFTQSMKGNQIDQPKEYVPLALGLYVSIINTFLFTLRYWLNQTS